MTQPKFAPIGIEDEVRPGYKLAVPRPWTPHRPGDVNPHALRRATGAGPDQGYLSLLAQRYVDTIVLGDGEHLDDVIAGATAIGMARASLFGRAPVGKDFEYALTALGYRSPQTSRLIEVRAMLIGGVAHDLWHRHELVANFTNDMLKMTAEEAGNALWSLRGVR